MSNEKTFNWKQIKQNSKKYSYLNDYVYVGLTMIPSFWSYYQFNAIFILDIFASD